ncbi:type 1 glutamine amidotransferase [Halosimplex amylolyticum]|uniref:type 1 glutamine amidotransferase n=1 Tax=Halosimplex amylolyticum TaxID=3396616 RepID=UPI003F57BEA9
MESVRVALLNASYNDAATRKNFHRDVDADLREFTVNDGELPGGYDYDAAIVSGSGASVYGDEPWIPPLLEWVDGAVERDLPLLGVCFGHQLLARALGGEVRDMGEYEIGYREIDRVGESELLAGVPERFLAFTTHSDEVARLPPDADLIAENDYSVQGFRRGRVFGVQFHPEYDAETAETVTRDRDLAADHEQAVLESISVENVAAAYEAKSLFDNFLSHAADGAPDDPNIR